MITLTHMHMHMMYLPKWLFYISCLKKFSFLPCQALFVPDSLVITIFTKTWDIEYAFSYFSFSVSCYIILIAEDSSLHIFLYWKVQKFLKEEVEIVILYILSCYVSFIFSQSYKISVSISTPNLENWGQKELVSEIWWEGYHLRLQILTSLVCSSASCCMVVVRTKELWL